MKEQISVFEFLKKFPDEATCEKHIEASRWPTGRSCPTCGSHTTYRLETQKRFKCGKCKSQFTVRTGSILAESKVPLQKWLMAIWILTTHSKGMSSVQLGKTLGVTQKTAWFLAHRIREAYTDGSGILLKGSVEVDETFIGGKNKNKHASKKLKTGRGTVGKTAVIGLKQRDGKIKSMPITDTSTKTLHATIKKNVEKGANLYTDEHSGYKGLYQYNHESVTHSAGEYVKGMATTNSVESFWALLKRGYIGIYHYMSVEHLGRYVNEFAFRHNVNDINCSEALSKVLFNANGKRITYKDLILHA